MPNKIETIAQQNIDVATYVAETPGPINSNVAQLVARNIAVLADRLHPFQVKQLSPKAKSALTAAAEVASQLTPVSPEDMQRLPQESASEHSHRTATWHPLHKLQAHVQHGEYDPTNEDVSEALKQAVFLGSVAFTEIINDPLFAQSPNLTEATNYFQGNTSAALGSSARQLYEA